MPTPPTPTATRLQRFGAGALRAFHAYGSWLAGISWKRFFVLSLLLLIATALLQQIPPFSWKTTELVPVAPRTGTEATRKPPRVTIERDKAASGVAGKGVTISIDEGGVRIVPRAAAPASAASVAASGAGASAGGPAVDIARDGVRIKLPPGATTDEVVEAVEEAKREVLEALAEAEAEAGVAVDGAPRMRVRTVRLGDFLIDLAMLFIASSAILKITYKRTVQAEVQAAQAQENADAEALRRQVVEARMAAMQAQVEPHFLFNTLASIDHLIETDPPRASQMQKNLIALLRASMPTMREASGSGPAARDLGRELAVIRPYLEILKMRMEERLATDIRVPEGLHSAEFPPMMLQSLVENAVKHGLEPKAEGGTLTVAAEIVHGRLAVTVADTGIGFGKADTAGTGIGLANIRERLALLYGSRASVTVADNQPSGTVVTITVPYVVHAGDATMPA